MDTLPAPDSAAPPAPAPPAVDATRWLAVLCLLALVVLGLAWELWLEPSRTGAWWAAVKAAPLCLALAGVLRLRMYTYRWLSLLIWLYVLEGAVRAWPPGPVATPMGIAQVLLCFIVFAACAAHVRLRLRKAHP